MKGLFSRLKSNEVFLHSLISVIIRVISTLSIFMMSVIVGRYLNVEESGLYFLTFTIITFLAAISRAGFDNTIVRFVGASIAESQWANIRFVLYRALIVSTTISSLLTLVLFFSADWLAIYIFSKPHLAPVIKAMAPGIIGLTLFTLLAMALQGIHKVAPSVFVLNISANVLVVLGLVLFELSDALSAAYVFSLSSILTFFIGVFCWFCFAKHCRGPISISWSDLLNSCFPLWIVMLMGQLTQWSGQFVAGAYVSSEEVAQLVVAQRTAMLISFILMAVNLVVAPRFAALYKQGDLDRLESLALNSVKIMVLLALPVVVFMMSFPSFLLGLFGEGFSSGAQLLRILAVGQFVNVVTGSVGFLLTMSGHEKDLRNTVLVSGPIAVALAFILVPILGATGSAIATALAIATQNLLAVFLVRKRLGFNTLAVWR